jgi:hypothetical protein
MTTRKEAIGGVLASMMGSVANMIKGSKSLGSVDKLGRSNMSLGSRALGSRNELGSTNGLGRSRNALRPAGSVFFGDLEEGV